VCKLFAAKDVNKQREAIARNRLLETLGLLWIKARDIHTKLAQLRQNRGTCLAISDDLAIAVK
jgi:hypothetical protein